MALVTVAVVGKDNVPLYLRDFQSTASCYSFGEDLDVKDDPFGFFGIQKSNANEDCDLKNQVRRLHFFNYFLWIIVSKLRNLHTFHSDNVLIWMMNVLMDMLLSSSFISSF